MPDDWRIAHEHSWKPAQGEVWERRELESWQDRWQRLTGNRPPKIMVRSGEVIVEPDRLGHLLDLGIATEENAL